MGTASSHRLEPDSLSASERQDQSGKYPSSPSTTPSNDSNKNGRSQHSGLSVVSSTHTGQRPIVAVAHRYQRSWKSRLAASMRQARDFLSRPRAATTGRTYSSTRRVGHTVNGPIVDIKTDVKVDINTATKAELQRLPGLDSSLASAIVEHRKLLVGGRFKRIEDLVNIPGLDVERLNRFRDLVTLSRGVKASASGDSLDFARHIKNVGGGVVNLNNGGSPTVASTTSDRITVAQTTANASVSPNYSAPRLSSDSATVLTPLASTALLNVNKATEQDFVQIAGIPEEVAKKIVMARQNNGPFHAVADIRRVKGVSKSLFARVRERLMVDDTLSHKTKRVPPHVPMSSSASSGNCRPSETDSGIATLSVAAASTNSNPGQSAASASTSKQVSPDSTVREMDINNLPDVIIKYAKPSDLELIHKLQLSHQTSMRGRGRGLAARGHQRNVSDFGVIADYTEICSPVYPSDMHGIRPIVEPFDFRSPSGTREPVVRFAFWDVEECGMDKISNPGVLETICMTILENGVSIVAFTDLLDAGVVDRIADQLTWPSLHCVREWRGARGSWRSAIVKTGYRSGSSNNIDYDARSRTSSGGSSNGDVEKQPVYCGFIYDTSRSIEMVNRCHYSSPLQLHKADECHESKAQPECLSVALPKTALHKLAFRPAAAKFSLSGSHADSSSSSFLSVVCLKLSPEDSAFFRRRDIALSTAPLLTAVLEAVNSFGDASTNKQMPVVLAGSFGVDANERCFDLLKVAGYQLVASEKTNISRKQPNGTMCGDQVWFTDVGASSSAVRQFTGRAGVVRRALTHPQIPDGWAWGGLVSSHCPVWAEFFTTPQPCESANGNGNGNESPVDSNNSRT